MKARGPLSLRLPVLLVLALPVSAQPAGHVSITGTVVDDSTGRIYLLSTWNLGTDNESQIISWKSKDVRHPYICYSDDDGKSWSKPTCISGSARLDDWGWYATGPGVGIQIKNGKYAGRLVIPCDHSYTESRDGVFKRYNRYGYGSHVIYSDDHGKTWQVSRPVQSGTGEGTLAEVSNGSIYYNSRSHMSVDHRRRIAWSHNGGEMWVDWHVSETLREVGEPFYFKYGTKPSYGCNAGLVRMPLEATDGKDVLLFSTPDNPGGGRVKMTVWASFDRGETWPVKRLVYDGPSAYSSLSADTDGNIYLLFERGDKKLYEKIALARFNLSWLAGGED